MTRDQRVQTWQLRARFAAALSEMYGAEVPAYTTLVDVATWSEHFPATDEEMAAQGLAYYRGGDPTKPIVYEDFLPVSAAGIFRSNLDTVALATEHSEHSADSDYDQEWLSGAIGRDLHDPYVLYQKAAS